MTASLLRRVFLDVLQRNPSSRELDSLSGFALRDVAQLLLFSREAMEQWLELELRYFMLLDRFRPTDAIVRGLPERLLRHQATPHDVVGEIVRSSGFSLRNPGNDTFATVVLEQCLGVDVQQRAGAALLDAGKRMYDGERARLLGEVGSSQADLVRIVLAQTGCTRHLVHRHHRRLIGEPQPGKLDPVVEAVHADRPRMFAAVVEWLASAEYAARPSDRALTDEQFARSLYLDLLGRVPEYEELRNVRNAMLAMADPTPLRGALVKVILDSGEAKLPAKPDRDDDVEAFVNTCFARWLRRPPTQIETAEFAGAVREGARAVDVARALLGSVEYVFY